eukprot:CAMPEP_0167823414 /NCGR_PEP_ID=MMETSP0112_2-20121227/8089_1 /TAXON_ID=91324 /ORGANISM="Lotharella globosa, Strain CCCM811" /LENGTH=469 /DNA_ID=CAMNT_0007724991 /DNA_START=8 /DNA_END=1417 /DNA_ORIENTATION=-
MAVWAWAVGAFCFLASGLSNIPNEKCLGQECTPIIAAEDRITPERCTVLENTQNAVYSIKIKIGTPKKEFRVVADTGSNVLVVPGISCAACKRAGKELYNYRNSKTAMLTRHASKITYGSGTVQGPLIHDTVTAIGVESSNQSMLIMEQENIQSYSSFSFDGIMGMGMPVNAMGTKNSAPGEDRSFFAQAGVDAFTMCFGKGPRPNGVLKLGSKRNTTFMFEKVIGEVHWGVKLDGVHIDDDKDKIDGICQGQKGCAVIVDSGTTLIMAPSRHLVHLYSSLCSFLPSCESLAGKNAEPSLRSDMFLTTLLSCPDEMDNLPDLKFSLSEHKVSLTKETYIMKAHTKELAMNNFMSGLNHSINFAQMDQLEEACVPAFMPMRMRSRKFGPIWIFGMPLMREYTVMFNRNQGSVPAVGFSKTSKCTGCNEGAMVSAAGLITKYREEPTHLSPTYIRKPNLILEAEKSEYVRL